MFLNRLASPRELRFNRGQGASDMINVGVVGLGMMGLTHLDAYVALGGEARVVAVADAMAGRLAGKEKAGGNVEGMDRGNFDLSTVKRYTDGLQLIADPEVQLVDI